MSLRSHGRVTGQKFQITDLAEVKKGVLGSQEQGRKGKYFLEG